MALGSLLSPSILTRPASLLAASVGPKPIQAPNNESSSVTQSLSKLDQLKLLIGGFMGGTLVSAGTAQAKPKYLTPHKTLTPDREDAGLRKTIEIPPEHLVPFYWELGIVVGLYIASFIVIPLIERKFAPPTEDDTSAKQAPWIVRNLRNRRDFVIAPGYAAFRFIPALFSPWDKPWICYAGAAAALFLGPVRRGLIWTYRKVRGLFPK